MLEKEIQKQLIEYLRKRGDCLWIVMPNEAQKKRQYTGYQPGVPDILLLKNGNCLFFELKTKTGTMKPDQQEWQNKLNRNYFDVTVGYGLDDVLIIAKEWLDEQ